MDISSIFSARNVTLLVFILVVLFLGATFDVKVGPESFHDVAAQASVAATKTPKK
jgi:hypothetical protein